MDSASSVLAIHRAIPYSDPALPSSRYLGGISFATGSFLYSDSCQPGIIPHTVWTLQDDKSALYNVFQIMLPHDVTLMWRPEP